MSDQNADLRELAAEARARGSMFAVCVVRRRWPARTTFGQRVRVRGSLVARYLGPTHDGAGTLVDLHLDDVERWLARQDRRRSPEPHATAATSRP